MMEEERLGGRRGWRAGVRAGRGPLGLRAGAGPGRAASPGQCPEAPAPLLPRDPSGVTARGFASGKTPLPPFPLDSNSVFTGCFKRVFNL